MEITKLMRCVLCAVVLAALVLVGCQKADIYKIDAPGDLQGKIDSIENAAIRAQEIADSIEAAELAALEARFVEDIYQVGVTDNSTGWWSAFSKYYRLETNADTVMIKFKNFTSGNNVWNNWIAAVTSDDVRQGTNGYVEYCIWRADNHNNFAWGTQNGTGWNTADGVDQAQQQTTNYDDMATENENFEAYTVLMQGADCLAQVTRGGDTVYVKVTMTPLSGTVLKKEFYIVENGIEDQPVRFWLFTEGGHIVVYKTIGEVLDDYIPDFELDPSWNSGTEDFNPVSISVAGTPESVELGSEDFWGDGVATVTFSDGSFLEVDTADITFSVIPDMTTTGTKTVFLAYGKTKQGAYCQPVQGTYTLEVSASIESISASNINYYFYGTDDILFSPNGIEVTAHYTDASTSVLDNVDCMFPSTLTATAGAQNINISYAGASSTFNTTSTVTLVQGTSQVGATDFSTGFWGAHSADYTVASGTSETLAFYTYSNQANNWNCPITVLRAADYSTEYAVTRWDNAGWGDGYATATASSDWNWDIFRVNISGSRTVLTVTNNGDDTADVRYDVTYANGETHFQLYEGITVTSSDLTFAITVENCYHVIVD